jgi:hypothetical protein
MKDEMDKSKKIDRQFVITIQPAIPLDLRHKIEDLLENENYTVHDGGQYIDGSQSDISFSARL